MAKRSEQEDEQPDTDGVTSTPHLDRLEKLANAAATAAQAKQWRGGCHINDEYYPVLVKEKSRAE